MSNEVQLEVVSGGALQAIQAAEIDRQIATAIAHPRSMAKFKARAIDMATIDEDTAASCLYSRPVGGGKLAEGHSVRMAEIVGACYGNLRVGAMIVSQTDRQVVARGVAHDLESNFAASTEVVEATIRKDGTPYDERQRAVVAKAALAKARRDATFQVVPKALCKPIESAVRQLLVGDAKSLESRRAAVRQWVVSLNIDPARVWTVLGVANETELGAEHLTTLTGIRTAIKDGEVGIDEAFPALIAKPKIGNPLTASAPVPTANPKDGKEPSKRDQLIALLAEHDIPKVKLIEGMVSVGILPKKTAWADIGEAEIGAALDRFVEIKNALEAE